MRPITEQRPGSAPPSEGQLPEPRLENGFDPGQSPISTVLSRSPASIVLSRNVPRRRGFHPKPGREGFPWSLQIS